MGFGDAQISGGGIVMRSSADVAGDIVSCIWNGKEFLAGYNNISGGPWGVPPHPYTQSWSYIGILQGLFASGNHLATQQIMRYQTNDLSNDICNKDITIGFIGIDRIIDYYSMITLGEAHPPGSMGDIQWNACILEQLYWGGTGDFHNFYTYNPANKSLVGVPASGGGYFLPVIMATNDGNYAVGIYTLNPFEDSNSKWSNVLLHNPDPPGVPGNNPTACPTWWSRVAMGPGQYTFRNFICIGTLAEVQPYIDALHLHFGGNKVTISFTSPTNNQTVSGILNAVTVPSSNVVSIKYYVDDVFLTSEETAPYGFSLDTTLYVDGSHTLKAIAYDVGGNTGETSVTVSFLNGPSLDERVSALEDRVDALEELHP